MMGLCSVYCGNIVLAYTWFSLEMLYVVCARFTVEMLYQQTNLYGLMLGLLWKYCIGYTSLVYSGNVVCCVCSVYC